MSHYSIIELNLPKKDGIVRHDVFKDNRLWIHDVSYLVALDKTNEAMLDSDTVDEYYESSGNHVPKSFGRTSY